MRTVIALAVLSGPLPKLGVIAVACLAAVAMIARDDARPCVGDARRA